MRVRPQLALAGVAVGWGSIGVLVREIPLPAIVIVAFRVWIAALALGLWLSRPRSRDGRALFSTPDPVRTIAMGVALAVHWVAMFAALKRAPIGTVLFIIYLAPVAIALLAPRTLGEAVSTRTIAALVLGASGMVLVAAPALDISGTGLAFAMLAAALYVVLVLVGKPLSESHGGLRLAFLQLAVAGVALVPFAAAAQWSSPEPSWGWLVVLGLVHTACGLAVFYAVLARSPASQVGILAYLEPASAVVFGWIFLSEVPSAGTIVGGILIAAAGAVVLWTRGAPGHPIATPEVADVPG